MLKNVIQKYFFFTRHSRNHQVHIVTEDKNHENNISHVSPIKIKREYSAGSATYWSQDSKSVFPTSYDDDDTVLANEGIANEHLTHQDSKSWLPLCTENDEVVKVLFSPPEPYYVVDESIYNQDKYETVELIELEVSHVHPLVLLSKFVLVRFLAEWLSMNEICKLESSFCSHASRPKLLNIIQSRGSNCTYKQLLDGPFSKPSFVSWANQRLLFNSHIHKIIHKGDADTMLHFHSNAVYFTPHDPVIAIKHKQSLRMQLYFHLSALLEAHFSHSDVVDDAVLTRLARHSPLLEKFSLHKCQFVVDYGLIQVREKCLRLQSLSVIHCVNVTNKAFGQLSGESRTTNALTDLVISECPQLSDEAFLNIATQHVNLQRLAVTKCNLSAEALRTISLLCVHLVDLKTSGCRDGERLVHFNPLQSTTLSASRLSAERMDFSECFNLSNGTLTEVCRLYRGLKEISLIGCPLLTLSSIRNLAANCVQLESVSLGYTLNTDDTAVCVVAEHCSRLKHLCVHMADVTISDTALLSVGEHCSLLESFVLTQKLRTFCAKFTNRGINAVSQGCPGLTLLDIGECTELSDSAIVNIAQRCRKMRRLRLHNCPMLTDASLFSISAGLIQLEHFEYTKNSRFTAEALGDMQSRLAHLQRVVNSTVLTPQRPIDSREYWYDHKL